MERMFFLVNGVLYVPGYLYLRRYYDELLPLWCVGVKDCLYILKIHIL